MTEERQLGGGVDLLQADEVLGGDGPYLAEHAGVLHRLEQLHAHHRLRDRVGVQEVPVEDVGDGVPVEHPLLVVLGEGVALGQEVQHRKLKPELDQGAKGHRGYEAVGGPAQRRVGEVDDHGVVPPERLDGDLGGLPEREELQLARRVDQGVVRLVGAHDVHHLPDVHGHEVRRNDLGPVRSEGVLLHDLVQGDPLAYVHIGLVGQGVRPRIHVHHDGVHTGVIHPVPVRTDQGALSATSGSHEEQVLHQIHTPMARATLPPRTKSI